MTIASTTTKQTMLGDGITRDWPFTFRAWENEVRVIVADAAGAETDVTALSVIELDDTGGTVLYPVDPEAPALPPEHRIVIMRAMDFVQETRLINVTRFDPRVIEDQLDRLIANDQQLQEQADRALAVGVASDRDPTTVIGEVFQARDRAETAATAAGNSQSAATTSAEAAAESATAAGASAQEAKEWAEEAKDASTQGPTATPGQKGLVPAGGTARQIYRVNAAGTAYDWEELPTATATAPGLVRPDGASTFVDGDGTLSAAGVPSGGIIMWSGTAANIPAGWALCDGTNGTPNLQNRFVMGIGGDTGPHAVGGSYKTGATTLTVSQMPAHTHGIRTSKSDSTGPYNDYGVSHYQTNETVSAGGSQAHDHDLVPPFYALAFIMRM